MICPQCQTQNPAGARFCQRCGFNLLTPIAPPPAQPVSPGLLTPPRPATSSRLPQALPAPPQPSVAQPTPPPTNLSAPDGSWPARAPRKGMRLALLIAAAALVLLAVAGGGTLFYLRYQQNARTGHWIAVATAAPGRPTPTVPPGAYAFTDPGGNPVIYYPPAQAPVAVTWQTYRDTRHGYHLELPGNWTQFDQSPTLPGARMVCPPGADTQDNEPGAPECVTYGWVSSFTLPAASDPGISGMTSITAGRVSGTLYTESALGTIVTAVFPSAGGDMVITTFGNSDALMYAFVHMLATLSFS